MVVTNLDFAGNGVEECNEFIFWAFCSECFHRNAFPKRRLTFYQLPILLKHNIGIFSKLHFIWKKKIHIIKCISRNARCLDDFAIIGKPRIYLLKLKANIPVVLTIFWVPLVREIHWLEKQIKKIIISELIEAEIIIEVIILYSRNLLI